MKLFFGLTLVAVSLLGAFAFSELRQTGLLSEQLANYERQNTQLLAQIENNSLKNIETAKALSALQRELNERDSRLAALSRQLESAEQQIDPDYQELEARIRQQLSRELQDSNSELNSDPRITVLNQLTELDPMVLGEIIALNAQFGEFINELNVSEDRKEVVINALLNMLADQRQAQSELIQRMQSNPQAAFRGELFQQMNELSNPNSQLEALSYELTETELDAFGQYREQQQRSSESFQVFSGTAVSPAGDAGFFSGELIPNGSGQPPVIQVLPIDPNN